MPRYLSTKLLNRITFYELHALRKIIPEVAIVNGLSMDDKYEGEPDRSDEVLQSWEALSSLLGVMTMAENTTINLKKCGDAIKSAYELYTLIKTRYRLDPKSDNSHLEPLQEGVSLFKKRAEI